MSLNRVKRSQQDRILNEGSWNDEQCLKYIVFLDLNKSIMTSRQKKKIYRVFDQMSRFIETRTSLQCRSHHQKAIERHKQIKQILQHEKNILDIQTYRNKLKQAREQVKIKENTKNITQNSQLNSQNALKSSILVTDGIQVSQAKNLSTTNFYNINPFDYYSFGQFVTNNFPLQFYYFPTYPNS